MKKNQRGITLIVLIITVIILLILAGISIGIIAQNDVIDKSKKAVNDANSRIIEDSEQEGQIYNDHNNEIGRPIKGNTGVANTN